VPSDRTTGSSLSEFGCGGQKNKFVSVFGRGAELSFQRMSGVDRYLQAARILEQCLHSLVQTVHRHAVLFIVYDYALALHWISDANLAHR
jgi:hypothetical protein